MVIKPIDIIVVAVAVIISLVFILRPTGDRPKRLVLLVGEQKITLPFVDNTINLSKYTGKDMMLEVNDGKAKMLSSTCPDKVCVHSGWIDGCGHMIICMPNGTAVMIDCTGALDEAK